MFSATTIRIFISVRVLSFEIYSFFCISEGFFDRLNLIILNLEASNLDSLLRFIVFLFFLFLLSLSKSKKILEVLRVQG